MRRRGFSTCVPGKLFGFHCAQISNRNRTSLGRANRPMKMAICFRERQHRSQAGPAPASPQGRIGHGICGSAVQSVRAPVLYPSNETRRNWELDCTPYPDFPEVKCWHKTIIVNVGSDTQAIRMAMDDTRAIRSVSNQLICLANSTTPVRHQIASV